MNDQEIQKYIKQVRNEANEDMKLHLGALNEMHGENLKAIREGNVIVNKQIKEINQKLDSHLARLSKM